MLKIGFFCAGYFKPHVWIWEHHFLACENGFQNHSSHFQNHQCGRFLCHFKCIVTLSLGLKNCMIFHVLWNTLNYLSLSACFFPSTIYTVNEQNLSHYLHRPKMACKWFGEIPSCCSLTLLLGPAWVLLKYFFQTIFLGPVFILEYWNLHVNFYLFS